MMYSFNYKRGTQVFDNVKSLADAINFELPRKWYCRICAVREGSNFEKYLGM